MVNVIDRRLNPRDKNLINRQRFIERAKEQVKRAVNDAIHDGKISDIDGKNVKVPVRGTKEPTFSNDHKTGERRHIVPGNKEFIEGDKIDKPSEGSGGGGRQGSPEGQGEDDFQFTLTKSEFYNFFFEELELPDLVKKQIRDIEKMAPRRAGFTNLGNPSQLDVRMSMRNAIGRRIALDRPKPEEIAKLEKQLELLDDAVIIHRLGADPATSSPQEVAEQQSELRARIDHMKRRMKAIPWIDPFDVRYRNYVMQPKPITQAVMFCCLDVSGSMGDREKDIAKRFFMLLYLFLSRKYENVDIIFVRHHTVAEECDEHEFFYKKESGGTVVSSGLRLINEIVSKRYPVNDWNIYVAQASDGDNYSADNDMCREQMEVLLPRVQHFAYLDITREQDVWSGSFNTSDIWKLYREIMKDHPQMAIKQAANRNQIWGVFKELFAKAPQTK